jgi:hypothetical protein
MRGALFAHDNRGNNNSSNNKADMIHWPTPAETTMAEVVSSDGFLDGRSVLRRWPCLSLAGGGRHLMAGRLANQRTRSDDASARPWPECNGQPAGRPSRGHSAPAARRANRYTGQPASLIAGGRVSSWSEIDYYCCCCRSAELSPKSNSQQRAAGWLANNLGRARHW